MDPTNLSKLNISEEKKEPKLGLVPLAKKLKKNENGRKVLLETNIRPLLVKPNTPFFKYSVSLVCKFERKDGGLASLEISKSSRKGAANEDDKEMCHRAYKEAVGHIPQLQVSNRVFYDRQASLYSTEKLMLGEDFVLQLQNVSKASNFRGAEFTLKAVAETFQATSNDIARCANSSPALADKTLLECLNAILSGQVHSNSKAFTVGDCVHYVSHPEEHRLANKAFAQGVLKSTTGIRKGVKILEGADRDPGVFVVQDMTETLFHPDNTSLYVVLQSYDKVKFRPDLQANSPFAKWLLDSVKGMEVYLNYGRNKGLGEARRVVKIVGFGASSDEEQFTTDSGERTNVTNHLYRRYQTQLRYPKLFTIIAKGTDGKMGNYPVEVLVTCRSQKVVTSQMINNEQRDMIRLAALRPADRKEKVEKASEAVGLGLKDVCGGDIRVLPPVQVEGRVIDCPKIVFGDKKQALLPTKGRVPTDFGKPTSFSHFHQAKVLTNWELCYLEGEDAGKMQLFKNTLLDGINASGMGRAEPEITVFRRDQLEEVFKRAAAKRRSLLFFIIQSKENLHQDIKCLEQKHDILTQEIKAENAYDFHKKPQTRQNLINKMNLKLGGLNYKIQDLIPPGVLIMGFETAQGGGGDGPVTIGFSANMMDDYEKYAGGYVFAERGKDGDIYGSILKKVILKVGEQFNKHKKALPSKVVIFFSGVTEGQYALINEVYAKRVEEAFVEMKQPKPTITLIATSKSHNERLYLNENGTIQNPAPGTTVDRNIVSSNVSEYYMVSSVARQGTSKPVKYTVVTNTFTALTLELIQKLVWGLCFNHQIVFHPTSLPAPLVIASSCSERGATVLKKNGPVYVDGAIDYQETNRKLGYWIKDLFGTRFNA